MEISLTVSTRLQYQHESLPELIRDLTDEQVRRQVIPGKWSIFENIVHLQTYQHVFIARIKRIGEEDTPVFKSYVADADPLFHDSCSLPTATVLQDLANTRKEMCAAILSLERPGLAKAGIHTTYGKMDLLKWINFFLLHEAHHLLTLFKLAAQLRKEEAETDLPVRGG